MLDDIRETKDLTEGKIVLQSNKRICMASLAAITTAIRRQVPFATDLFSKALQHLLPPVSKEDEFLNRSVSAAHMKLSAKVRNAFATLSDTKVVIHIL